MVGLDAAGKTTILYKLKLGEIVTTIPTIGTPAPPLPAWSRLGPAPDPRKALGPRPGRWQAQSWRASESTLSQPRDRGQHANRPVNDI